MKIFRIYVNTEYVGLIEAKNEDLAVQEAKQIKPEIKKKNVTAENLNEPIKNIRTQEK